MGSAETWQAVAAERFARASLERSPILRERLQGNPAGYNEALRRLLGP